MSDGCPHAAIVVLPEQSALNASFKFAKELRRAGLQITYIGPPAYREHVSAQGFGYQPLLPDPIVPDDGVSPSGTLGRRWRNFAGEYQAYRQYLSNLLEAHGRLAAWLSETAPSIALVEPMMWEFAPPFLRQRVPIVGLTNTLTAKFAARFPPVFSATPAIENPGTFPQLGYLARWGRLRAQFAGRHALETLQILAHAGPFAFATMNPASMVRRCGGVLCFGEYGLRLDVPELVLAPKVIDFPEVARQPERHYIGSCVDTERKDAPFDWGAIDRHKGFTYCSLGTYSQFYGDAPRLFRSVIEALRNDPNRQAILQVGSEALIRELGPQPNHILLAARVPQLDVLRHARLFITHGGIGAVREGLFFGVPMLVFPCWLDQPGNAARLVYHGVALSGDIRTVDAPSLQRLIREATSCKMREAVTRMSEAFRQEEDCRSGVEWILRYLGNPARAACMSRSNL
jgi:UDP:flavonoid glycosyltransferase YjiC (YdhE family)